MITAQTHKIGGHRYSIGRLSTFDQLELATAAQEVLFNLVLIKRDAQSKGAALDDAAITQAALALMGHRLDDSKRRKVRDLALSCVSRITADGSGMARVIDGGQFMFDGDIDLPDLMLIIYRVLEVNKLVDFFSVKDAVPAPPKAATT